MRGSLLSFSVSARRQQPFILCSPPAMSTLANGRHLSRATVVCLGQALWPPDSGWIRGAWGNTACRATCHATLGRQARIPATMMAAGGGLETILPEALPPWLAFLPDQLGPLARRASQVLSPRHTLASWHGPRLLKNAAITDRLRDLAERQRAAWQWSDVRKAKRKACLDGRGGGPASSGPAGIRTLDTRIKSPMLYRTELPAREGVGVRHRRA